MCKPDLGYQRKNAWMRIQIDLQKVPRDSSQTHEQWKKRFKQNCVHGSSDEIQWWFLHVVLDSSYIQFTSIYNKKCMMWFTKLFYTQNWWALALRRQVHVVKPTKRIAGSWHSDFSCMENARSSAVFFSCSLMVSAVWLMRQLSGLYRDWTRRFSYSGTEYSLNFKHKMDEALSPI